MKLAYVQPLIASYRMQVVRALAAQFEVTVIADMKVGAVQGFQEIETLPVNHIVHAPRISILDWWLLFQPRAAFMSLHGMDAVLIDANVRSLSLWLLLIRCRLARVKLYAHGQGLYRFPKPTFLRRVLYRITVDLSTTYICYNELSKKSLVAIGCSPNKLAVADNSLELNATVSPDSKNGMEQGVLFIGRLRSRCRLEKLFAAIASLRAKGHNTIAHVIGTGEMEEIYRKRYENENWIIWHGGIFDDVKIAEISRQCRIGCYPGDAGLSIVHCFGLSLPPLVHDRVHQHMGPEPYYIKDRVDGFLFPVEGLTEALEKIWVMPAKEMQAISSAAYRHYQRLANPSLGRRLAEIIGR